MGIVCPLKMGIASPVTTILLQDASIVSEYLYLFIFSRQTIGMAYQCPRCKPFPASFSHSMPVAAESLVFLSEPSIAPNLRLIFSLMRCFFGLGIYTYSHS